MKPARFLSALLLVAFAVVLRAEPQAAPNFSAYKGRTIYPHGLLGFELGTFAVIEGVERLTNKSVGGDDFVIASVNGVKSPHPVTLQIAADSRRQFHLKAGTRYILHGWEAGTWQGQPDSLPSNAEDGWTQGGGFIFQHTFQISSVESADGVTAPDAKPIDPNVPLTKPDFSKPPDGARPIGVLGLPLGTFAEIKVQKPVHPTLMDDPYVVDSVNGAAAPPNLYLTIRNVKSKTGEVVSLHGYEAAEWENMPSLPKSEDPTMGREIQQPFQLYHEFRVIQCK